jgi:hypothetical protein
MGFSTSDVMEGRTRRSKVTSLSPTATRGAGELLREWRNRRRMSQLDLALEANVSARHLSFV